jgi:hypothetical protein
MGEKLAHVELSWNMKPLADEYFKISEFNQTRPSTKAVMVHTSQLKLLSASQEV